MHRYSDYHNRIVTQREGEDVSRRRSARRGDRSRCSLKFRMIVKRNVEGGRGLWMREPLSSHCHRQAQRLHTCDTLLRDCISWRPDLRLPLALSIRPLLVSLSFSIIRNYIIYTPQIYIFISLTLSKFVARSRRMERERINKSTHTHKYRYIVKYLLSSCNVYFWGFARKLRVANYDNCLSKTASCSVTKVQLSRGK